MPTTATLENAVEMYNTAKRIKAVADQTYLDAQESLIKAMEESGENQAEVNGYAYTVVRGVRTSVDAVALRSMLTAEVFDQVAITTYEVNKDKLSAAIISGLIKVEEVSSAITSKPTAPFIRRSEAKEAE
jgi:hypothetical protein